MTDLPIFNATIHAVCQCRDQDAAAVAHLMAQGISQRDASLIVYSDQLPDNPSPAVLRAWVARRVAAMFRPLREAVGLR